ncbi:Calmodulin-binding transcription activator 4 [Apostasia shenzhenica]|uniref:Calmodulin-binding transcription activator 4 n=1 Tax=Apostasia shenzhenica TaxID=1088818 RepID=A0A2I0AN26_9ASPA|nr:Calmodulin-binding transcription activator 4 [Apostasia shenzhenica]
MLRSMMQPAFDYDKLLQEAQSRWLKSSEVLFILQNYRSFPIEQEPPKKPPSGSLLLFNRRVARYFRKDGHMWRKKKDGRAVGEAHERLKVGTIEALNCYYAHGEQDPYFQRRSYWMLHPDYEHIVLVHYREVSEGRFLPPAILKQPAELFLNQSSNVNNLKFQSHACVASEMYNSYQSSASSVSGEVNSEYFVKGLKTDNLNMLSISENSDISWEPEFNQAFLNLHEDDDNVLGYTIDHNNAYKHDNVYGEFEDLALRSNELNDSFQNFHENLTSGVVSAAPIQGISAFDRASDPVTLADGSEPPSYTTSTGNYHSIGNTVKHETQFSSENKNIYGAPVDQLEKTGWQQPGHVEDNAEYLTNGSDFTSQLLAARNFLLGSDNLESPDSFAHLANTNSAGHNSVMVSGGKENCIDRRFAIDLPIENRASSSDLMGMWFDQGQLGTMPTIAPSLSAIQKVLRIREISPEWSFCHESTKVIITGDFLCDPSACSWGVMFGNVEVPAVVVQKGVLRCQTPELVTGKVSLCITSGNKESCSELKDFEFRAKPVSSLMDTMHQKNESRNAEEISLLVKLVLLLLRQSDDLPSAGKIASDSLRKVKAPEKQWLQTVEELQAGRGSSSETIDWILQELLKDKFQQWLLSKIIVKEDRNYMLSKKEQGIIHLLSGLGYEWALSPILDAGVGVNFRDAYGWTALHWAACFGREKMAAVLLASGALAGAVTDPTPQDPVGKTAGAIAAASGHKGLAGYLSEADLTSHLSSLTINECEISKSNAALKAEKAVESICERRMQLEADGTEDDLSLKDSLAAARNAAQAAARIQAAFRAHSFRKRQQKAAESCNEYGMTAADIFRLTSYRYLDQKFDNAALSIQKTYKGWKRRRDFLSLRRKVVKIQAHVRGHQMRTKYREILWSVSVVEKGILRWRRKGSGLRGYRPKQGQANEDDDEEEDITRVFRKQKVDAAIDQAVSRVFSVVESPRARQQYRRMLERYLEVKFEQCNADEWTSSLQDDFEMVSRDDFLY